MKNKEINMKTIIIIMIIGIIITLILVNLNNKNINIVKQEKGKERLTETTSDNTYVDINTHLSEVSAIQESMNNNMIVIEATGNSVSVPVGVNKTAPSSCKITFSQPEGYDVVGVTVITGDQAIIATVSSIGDGSLGIGLMNQYAAAVTITPKAIIILKKTS